MPRHFHFEATKTTEKGIKLEHRYVVAAPYADQEQKVAVEMGYAVAISGCHDHAHLGFPTVERPKPDDTEAD